MKIPRMHSNFLIFILSALILLLSGCSVMGPVGGFFSQGYVNTVSYFNTFYNAEKLFEEAVKELEEHEIRYRRQNRPGRPDVPELIRRKFNSVIEKCSRLLHDYPTSRYADNAVLKIGLSYYHMRQYLQAERKFLELLAEFPESRLVPESQLLLAKSQRELNKINESIVTLTNLTETAEGRRNRDIVARAYMELGLIERNSGELHRATEYFDSAINAARNRAIRTESRFHLAGVFVDMELYDRASEEYARSVADRPTPEILFEAQKKRANLFAREERYNDAIDLLADMLTDLRVTEYHSQIELEAAGIYYVKGDIDDAVHQYVYVDTTYPRTAVSTQAQYSLGNIFMNNYNNFSKAREYFERASRGTPVTDLVRDAGVLNTHLTRYERHHSEIERLDSTIAKNKKMFSEISSRADSLLISSAMLTADTAGVAADTASVFTDIADPEELERQIREDVILLSRSMYELAGLFFIEMSRPDSAFQYYQKVAFDYPESPYAPQSLYALAEIVRTSADENISLEDSYFADWGEGYEGSEARRDSLYHLLIEKYPESEFANEALRILGIGGAETALDPMQAVLDDAEDALLSGNHEHALLLFGQVIKEGESFIERSLYSIGWIYENIKMIPDSAIAYYQILTDEYPDSEYTLAVQEKLNTWVDHFASAEEHEEPETVIDSEMPIDSEVTVEAEEPEIPDEIELMEGSEELRNAMESPDSTNTEKIDED